MASCLAGACSETLADLMVQGSKYVRPRSPFFGGVFALGEAFSLTVGADFCLQLSFFALS